MISSSPTATEVDRSARVAELAWDRDRIRIKKFYDNSFSKIRILSCFRKEPLKKSRIRL